MDRLCFGSNNTTILCRNRFSLFYALNIINQTSMDDCTTVVLVLKLQTNQFKVRIPESIVSSLTCKEPRNCKIIFSKVSKLSYKKYIKYIWYREYMYKIHTIALMVWDIIFPNFKPIYLRWQFCGELNLWKNKITLFANNGATFKDTSRVRHS